MEIPVIIEIVSIVVGALAAIKIYKIVESFIFKYSKNKKILAESSVLETDALLKRYNTMEDRIKELEAKVESLYQMVYKLETDKIELMKEKMELSVKLKEALHNECRRPDDECLRRLPQREICLAKKLLGGAYDKEESDDTKQ